MVTQVISAAVATDFLTFHWQNLLCGLQPRWSTGFWGWPFFAHLWSWPMGLSPTSAMLIDLPDSQPVLFILFVVFRGSLLQLGLRALYVPLAVNKSKRDWYCFTTVFIFPRRSDRRVLNKEACALHFLCFFLGVSPPQKVNIFFFEAKNEAGSSEFYFMQRALGT